MEYPYLPHSCQTDLLAKLEKHLESYDVLGTDVGEGFEILDFLASLKDMYTIECLVEELDISAREREWMFSIIEEKIGCMNKSERLKEREKDPVWKDVLFKKLF